MSGSVEEMKYEKRLLLNKYLDERNLLLIQNKDAMFATDLEGHFVQVNPAFEQLLNFPFEEIVDIKLQSLIPVEELNRFFNYFQKSALGQFENFDSKITDKMNEVLDINVMFIPIAVDDQVIGVCGVIKDITLLKRKGTEIRKFNEIHRSLTDNVLDIILSINVFGEIQYITPSCERVVGFTPDEIVGRHFLELFHKDDFERALKDFKYVFTVQENGRTTYRLPKKDGSFVWVEIVCKPVIDPITKNTMEVVGVIRDITKQRKIEELLRSRKKAFRDIIDHSPDAVVIAKDLKVLYMNKTGMELFGAAREEDVLFKSIFDFIHPDDHDRALGKAQNIAGGEFTEFSEYKCLRLNGDVMDIEMKGIPTVFQGGVANYIYIRDLTEVKKTQKLLLQAEKLNTAGQLAAGIAHEVRNPITAIKGFIQLIEAGEGKQAYFDIMKSEIDRMELILRELVSIAKPQAIHLETVELESLISEVKTIIDTQAIINNIKLDIHNECQAASFIRCDQNQIKQVLINFLKNAIEAIKVGGMISVELKNHGLDKIKILIKDTGPGMPPNILKRIGEPFFTTKENGTGLGIMISKQIIENHQGTVHFWSDSKGTIVEIILPFNRDLE